jgi:FSR family fosmidomycin resistance protein-like MFS transporter
LATRTEVNAIRSPTAAQVSALSTEGTVFRILLAISFCHLLNDTVQSLLPAIYPLLKDAYHLDFGQIGLIALTAQVTASLLQPIVGLYTDWRPQPYFLPIGMVSTLVGLLALSRAAHFGIILIAAGLIGIGSAVFHPESSRVARMASGGRHGMAQSVFQLGGNAGGALGPLLAAFVLPHGQRSVAWFAALALLAIIFLTNIGHWAKTMLQRQPRGHSAGPSPEGSTPAGQHAPASAASVHSQPLLSKRRVGFALAILVALMFSKYIYLSSLNAYYTFYLMGKFHVSIRTAQLHLFLFLGSVAAGTFIGGPVGDRIGRKYVIWVSILGVLPFTLLLPYANLFWTSILTIVIGLILASAFSAILVYAQDLVPGKVGAISGLFFGLAFGLGGVGAAVLGKLADHTGINFVYHLCSYLPALGMLTVFLPNLTPSDKRSH